MNPFSSLQRKNENKKAISHLKESIQLNEVLLKTAQGSIRRDYLETMVRGYQTLSSCYVRMKEHRKALEILEMVRSKYLLDQIGSKARLTSLATLDIDRIQKGMGKEDGILYFSNLSLYNSIRGFISKEKIGMVQKWVTVF